MFRIREITYDAYEVREDFTFLVIAEDVAQSRNYIKSRYIDYTKIVTGLSVVVSTYSDAIPCPTAANVQRTLDALPDDVYYSPAGVALTVSVPTATGYLKKFTLEVFNLESRYGHREDGDYPEIADEVVQEPLCPCKNPVCDAMCGMQACGECFDTCECMVWARYRD